METDIGAQRDLLVVDLAQDAATPNCDLASYASTSDEDEPICRRLRQRKAPLAISDGVAHDNSEASAGHQSGRSTLDSHANREERTAVRRRLRGPRNPNSPKSTTSVDPVGDEMLLDCVLTMWPHALEFSPQRSEMWRRIARKLNRSDPARFTRYTAPGLGMRLAFLLRVIQNPLHPKHDDVQGSLREKLVKYRGSLPPHQATHGGRTSDATAQADDNVACPAAHQDDVNSDSGSNELFNTDARRPSRHEQAVTAPAPPQAQLTPHPQPSPRGDARASRGPLQQRRDDDHTASDVPGAAAAVPAQEPVVPPSSSALLANLLQQAAATRREHYDMGVLLARQANAVLEQNQRVLEQSQHVLEQSQRSLEQNQARMDDQREWCARCLSLLVQQLPPPAGGNALSGSEQMD